MGVTQQLHYIHH